jgi:hypothetical protein
MKMNYRMPLIARALGLAAGFFAASAAMAQSRQDDVLRSIQQNVGESVDPRKFIAAVVVIVGLIATLFIINALRNYTARPRVVNHRGKLLKEMSRTLSLKPSEMRQLKTLSEAQDIASPLVLLLCPSLLNKAVKSAGDRVDRSTVGNLARRLSGNRPAK